MSIVNSIRCSYTLLHGLSYVTKFINLFCPKFNRSKNIYDRTSVTIPREYINGQGVGSISELPYGSWTIKNNGCELIAVYNAMLALNKHQTLQRIAADLERHDLLFNGFGGTNLSSIKTYMQRQGVHVKVVHRCDCERFDYLISLDKYAIFSCWTGPKLRKSDGRWEMIHTVFVRSTDSGVEIFNWYGSSLESVKSKSLEDFIDSKNLQPICLLVLH